MARSLWFVELVKTLFPSRFIFAEMTKIPVVGHMVEYSLFYGDDIIYLPKDSVIQIQEDIGESDNYVLPSQVVDHFIEQAGYHWVMDQCICRAGDFCTDYPVDLGCIFLGEAVLDINPNLGQLVSKDEAKAHAKRCRDAGLVHMIGRNKLDSVLLGTSPSTKLLTICSCCPCCCLWRMIPYIKPAIRDKVHKMPGVTVTVTDLCAGCGTCAEGICFVDAIHMEDTTAVIDDSCRGCGRCVEICPNEAIELTFQDNQFVEDTIELLSPLIDLS
jgi:ferredoxin